VLGGTCSDWDATHIHKTHFCVCPPQHWLSSWPPLPPLTHRFLTLQCLHSGRGATTGSPGYYYTNMRFAPGANGTLERAMDVAYATIYAQWALLPVSAE
jgi:hypothetical protein